MSAAVKKICEERGTRKPVFVLLTGWGGNLDGKRSYPMPGSISSWKPVEVRDMLRSMVDLYERQSASQPKSS